MFDISFTELMLIGIVALVVIGPERLPRVARTVGHLIGRAQRYVGDVKSDIQREMEVDELKDLKGQMEEAAKSVKTSVKEATDTLRDPLEDARNALKDTTQSVESLVKTTQDELNELSKTTQDEINDLSEAATKLDAAAEQLEPPKASETIAEKTTAPRPLSDAELADQRLAHTTPSPDAPTHTSEPDKKSGTPL